MKRAFKQFVESVKKTALESDMAATVATPRYIEAFGYKNCIEIRNAEARVVLEPNVGGRVLYYEINGKNIIWLHEGHRGKLYDGEYFEICAGRFDIGPEMIKPDTASFFFGKWSAEITGQCSVRLTSVDDSASGIKLVRDFRLDPVTSHLECIQHIHNIGKTEKRLCHWSRTFASGNGISLTPLAKNSRYPKGYIVYGDGDTIIYKPKEEENVRVREGILEIIGPPNHAKFAMDSDTGWLAYISRNNLLFIKKFEIFPNKAYGEILGNTTSIWYNKDEVCEIEPIGPWEIILPGKSISFTEHWYLTEYKFPDNRQVNLSEIKRLISDIT